MAGKNGGPSAPVTPGAETSLKFDLLNEGHDFSFFQIMRLAPRLGRPREKGEAAAKAASPRVRVRPRLSLAFPPADVERVEERVEERKDGKDAGFLVMAQFLGLYGSSSPLPTFYTEDLMDEASRDESVSREFIDVVNQRFYHLLFQCWLKYRQFLQVRERGSEDDLERLYGLLGFGEKRLRADIPDPTALFRYIGLFTQRPRSAMGLRTLLSDALKVGPLEVTPCVERKAKIPEDQRLALGAPGVSLGENSFLGEEIRDRMGKFRISVGPLTGPEFQELLPGTEKYDKLALLTRLYILEPFEYDLELLLAPNQARQPSLGALGWTRLGMDVWVFSGDESEASRVVFHPRGAER
ncbi:MAG: type VI secretion system baseplate subunit TssG [Desulfobacterales bacterium]|nr:type VI secretion system baseplate subunit TssG [Desulfobacterales bacterium]